MRKSLAQKGLAKSALLCPVPSPAIYKPILSFN